MSQKVLVESLAMDLLPVALGLQRGSLKMAERFKLEALARFNELTSGDIKNEKLTKLLARMKAALESDRSDKYEDILMYSVLVQNFAIHRMKD